MTAKRIIVVIGATGNQGGSVVDTFLGLPAWHVRGLTRNPSSESAQKLKAKGQFCVLKELYQGLLQTAKLSAGVEVVQADLTDPASLTAAFAGANALFLNTDFWVSFNPTKASLEAEGKDISLASQIAFDFETTCGKNAAVAAASVPTLDRFVVSSLGSVATDGKFTAHCIPKPRIGLSSTSSANSRSLQGRCQSFYLPRTIRTVYWLRR